MANIGLSKWIIRWVDKIIIHFTTITHNRLTKIAIELLGSIGLGSSFSIPCFKFYYDNSQNKNLWQVIIEWNTEEIWPSIIIIFSILAISVVFCVNRFCDSAKTNKRLVKSRSKIDGNSNIVIQNSHNTKINGL